MWTLIIGVILISIFYFHATKNHDYWLKRNVKHDAPLPLFGNNLTCLVGMKSYAQLLYEAYFKYTDAKVVGFYKGTTPELILKDADIIRNVLNVDFTSFHGRGVARNAKIEPIMANILHADGDAWKIVRQHLTPAFTNTKLKSLFPLVVQCTEKLSARCEELATENPCSAYDLTARYTMECIGSCGFGVKMDTINNERSLFYHLGKIIFHRSPKYLVKLALWELIPAVRSFLHVSNPQIYLVIRHILNKVREQRNHKRSTRNDFIDLLMELEEKNPLYGKSIEKTNLDGSPKEVEINIDDNCMVAQMFIFFAAGYETSATAMSCTLHLLAFNMDIQRDVQEEVDGIFTKYNNKLCYEALSEMTLLMMCLKEAMRLFPSAGILFRVCTKRYTFSELNFTIDPGVKVVIPINALHLDEKYFENPEQFDPYRFTPEATAKRHKYSYMPFGQGPRSCIGTRLGEMQSLAGLATVLHQFSVEPTAASERKIRVDPNINAVQGILGGLPIRLKKRFDP